MALTQTKKQELISQYQAHETGTLVNALLAHCGESLSGINGVLRPGIVHRLDKDTSGVMVVAKSDRAHRGLAEQFADHGRTGPLDRAYRAICWGAFERKAGCIDAAIARSRQNREKMVVSRAKEGQVKPPLSQLIFPTTAIICTHRQASDLFYQDQDQGSDRSAGMMLDKLAALGLIEKIFTPTDERGFLPHTPHPTPYTLFQVRRQERNRYLIR